MTRTPQDKIDARRGLSRRSFLRGGLSVAAGALATVAVARDGSAAVTPLDVRRQSAPVEETDSTSTTTSKGGGRTK